MKIEVHNIEGKKVENMEISDLIFGLPKNDDLVHQVSVSLAANKRESIAHTKTRGERAGSGRKPWKQKGTGRARVGSVRTPLWKKGGIVFGPRSDRNYKKKINSKMNVKAILLVLSGKARDKEICVIDKMEIAERKTKEVAKLMKNLKILGKTLIVFGEKEKNMMIAGRNLKDAQNISLNQLNVLDMLRSRNLLVSKDSIRKIEEKYTKK
jgi:large subunit ribosomal protein L4